MAGTVVVIPLFNHAGTIVEVLDGVLALGYLTIVVDDGSSDDGAERVERRLADQATRGRLIRLPRNRGKAAALRRGLAEAQSLGARIAITVDADGQHDLSRIAEFERVADRAAAGPWMVLGDRGPIPRSYPLARLVGRVLSGLAVRAACGREVGDAACGMRAYRVEPANELKCVSARYAWEEEVIIRSAWSGGTTEEVVIPVIYRDPIVARSHYRFVRDWSEGFAVLGGAVLLRILNPTTRWAPDGARFGELAWPAVPGGRLTGLLAVVAAGISATVISAVALAGANGRAALFATGVVAVAAIRTRTPIAAVAVGAAAGITAPEVLFPLAMPAAMCASLVLIDRLRRNAGARPVRG